MGAREDHFPFKLWVPCGFTLYLVNVLLANETEKGEGYFGEVLNVFISLYVGFNGLMVYFNF